MVGFLITVGWMFTTSDGSFEIFGMDDKGDITGTVVFDNGTPAEGVLISIEGENFSTHTNADGKYYLYDVPTGNQKIVVEKNGYNTIVYKTFVDPSQSGRSSSDHTTNSGNEHDFTLTEGNQTLDRGSYPPWEFLSNLLLVCGAVILVFAVITLIGGIYAIKRTHFGFALTGAILGVLTGGILALIALFILLISREEFNGQANTALKEGENMA
jgi:hypothetical protein